MAEQPPNIVFIITDQQRFDTIRSAGFDYMDTPNLDRLRTEGVSFDRCYITAPSCAPARASLFTGFYPHTTGILKNADTWRTGWVSRLNEAGYHCINVGKMHTWPFTTPMGFDERYVVENKDRFLEGRYFFDEWDKALRARGVIKQQRELYRKLPDYRQRLGAFEWELDEDLHPDMFVGDLASWWIRTKPKSEPLFMEIGFPGPHPPYDPIPRYAEPYLSRDLKIDTVSEADLENQPEPFKGMRIHNTEVDHDSVVLDLNPSEQHRHRQRAYYLANVTMIDEKIGQIIASLEATGYLDNTIIVFTSDHGDCLTDHGHSQKWTMYEQVMRVPMIVWAPGRYQGGRTDEGLCQAMDIGPTILEMAGVQVPEPMAARSLMPALKGEPHTPRHQVFAEHCRDGNFTTSDYMTMVRTENWKLVHFLDEPWGQLFDLQSDPKEQQNLWDSAEHADRKQALLGAIRDWRIRDGYENAAWCEDWR